MWPVSKETQGATLQVLWHSENAILIKQLFDGKRSRDRGAGLTKVQVGWRLQMTEESRADYFYRAGL